MIGPHGRAAGRQGRSACKTSRPASIRVSFTHLARCVNGDAYNMRTVLRLQQNVFTHLDSTQTATKCDSGYDSLIRFLICHIDMPYWYAPYWKNISTTSLTSGLLHRLVIFSAFPRPPWHQVYYIDLWFFHLSLLRPPKHGIFGWWGSLPSAPRSPQKKKGGGGDMGSSSEDICRDIPNDISINGIVCSMLAVTIFLGGDRSGEYIMHSEYQVWFLKISAGISPMISV